MVATFAPKAGEIWTGSSHFAADQLKAGRLLEMPLVCKMAKDLWENRIHLTDRIARVLFNGRSHEVCCTASSRNPRPHHPKNSLSPSGVCNNSGAFHEQAHRQ
jgi:hypothetical protein